MSDFKAIGGVSATLLSLLKDRMELPPDVTDLNVVSSAPRKESQNGNAPEDAGVHLFLYRVTENIALKNQEIYGTGHPGSYGHPPLSLNLHYILTTYGSTADGNYLNETRSHYLLGSAMRVLHDIPVINESLLTVRAPAGQQILHQSLRGEFERVKIGLSPISLEDLSKVWTALTLPYRLSAAYDVSVVQIEGQRRRHFPKLVGEPPLAGPRVHGITLPGPHIDEVRIIKAGDPDAKEWTQPYARLGDTLVVKGTSLAGDGVRVLLGSVDATDQITDLTSSRIDLTVPDDVALQPGACPIRVARDLRIGDPPEWRRGFKSNATVFVLVPRVESVSLVGTTLTIQGTRLFHEDAECLTLIGNKTVSSAAYTGAAATEIEIDLPTGIESGEHDVRVLVDGIENLEPQTVTVP